MKQWHIGCSGFYYNHWKENFYPENLPKRLWFEYYSDHFNTLELNVTFYRFPKIEVFKGWYERSGSDFTFSVKAPRLITHFKKMNDCSSLLQEFYATVSEGLKEKTGAVLFQFPPRFIYSEEKLEKIISNLNPQFPNVVEFRDSSWWNTDVYKSLGKNGIAFCGMSHPDLPDQVVMNTSLLYYRMHGVPDLYRSPYSLSRLRKIINTISSSKKVKSVFIYFNNDVGAHAIENATQMKKMLANKKKKLVSQ